MDKMFSEFKDWCVNVGLSPSHATSLHEFVDKVQSGLLVKCDVCEEWLDDEYSFEARYDYEKLVCPDCHEDGN
jgi:hypothetical protein